MPAGEGRASVDTLRQAASWSVAAASLRQVAREVGMSPSGLQKFLDGAGPYSATRKKLEHWYVRGGSAPDVHSVLTAIGVLVQDLPPAERIQAMDRALVALEQSRPGKSPGWVKHLRSRLQGSR